MAWCAIKLNSIKRAKNDGRIETTACHCGGCRKWASGAYMAVHCKNKVEFTGFENITIFKSSKWAERGFCKKCGSNLFYHLIDKKPNYYQFANDTVNLTEAEIFAIFAPKD